MSKKTRFLNDLRFSPQERSNRLDHLCARVSHGALVSGEYGVKLRFIMRDGKRILQSHPGKFGDWQDVPLVEGTRVEKVLRIGCDFKDPGVLSFSEHKVFLYETQRMVFRANFISNERMLEKMALEICAPHGGTYWLKKNSFEVVPNKRYYVEILYYPGDRDISDELVDSPKIIDQTAPTEPTEQDIEDLESGEYRMGLRTVTFSRCIHNDPTCHCRES